MFMEKTAEQLLREKNQSRPKKLKKRRRSRYKTGFHHSPKCAKIFEYRSGWERVWAIDLDNDPNVVSYEYETIKIPYILNNKTGKIRYYIPDFIVTYINGAKIIYEVKNTNAMKNITVIKKAKAAELWAQRNGYQYQMITGEIILLLEKKQKLLTNPLKKK